MTIGRALKFIARGLEDQPFRTSLNKAASIPQLYQILEEYSLSFDGGDFEEAFNHRLTKCQELEAAEQLKEFKMWWELLHRLLANETPSDSSCASKSSCADKSCCTTCGG